MRIISSPYKKYMNKQITNIANKELQKLLKKYNGFINVGLDNWRGWRFVFDTIDVRKCDNNCEKCPLFLLLKDEKQGLFSSGLYPADKKDQSLFGFQRFLNCKILKQYEDCFVNFILKETKTKEEIKEELMLVKNFKVIFSKEDSLLEKERQFKKSVINKLLKKVDNSKKRIIQEIITDLELDNL